MIAPIFHELSEQIDSVVFLKVDVDENPDTAAKYSVSAMPTFVFIKGGEVVDRLMGANPARLKEMIEELSWWIRYVGCSQTQFIHSISCLYTGQLLGTIEAKECDKVMGSGTEIQY